MAKVIKLTGEQVDEIRRDFEKELAKLKVTDGKFSFTKSFDSVKRNATVIFTELAWLKMQSLVLNSDKEVGWHGLAKRGDENDTYIIYDILVYPQVVSAATVDTDQIEYQTWLMKQPDDIFNNLRMQGHSHVNMSCYPSNVDTGFYKEILDILDDTMFYIFMIWNKRGEKTIKIYDFAENIMFDTADCSVKITNDGIGVEDILAEARTMVRNHTINLGTSTPKPATITETTYTKTGSGWKSETKTSNVYPLLPKEDEHKPEEAQKAQVRKGKRSTKRHGSYGAYTGSYNFGATPYSILGEDEDDF